MTGHAQPPEGVETWTITVDPSGDPRAIGDVTDDMGRPGEPHPLGWQAAEVVKLSALLAEREAREQAQAELARLQDFRERLAFFDDADQPVMKSHEQMHRHHADEPYIGCFFCRDKFVLREQADAAVARAEQAEAERDEARNRVQQLEEALRLVVDREEEGRTDEDAWVKVGILAWQLDRARAALSPDPSGETG